MPRDRRGRLAVGEVVQIELGAEPLPVAGQHEAELLLRERWIPMRKPDTAVKLRIVAHAHLDARHTDQDQADVAAIEPIAEIFERGGGQSLRLVDDDELDATEGRCGSLGSWTREALVDAGDCVDAIAPLWDRTLT